MAGGGAGLCCYPYRHRHPHFFVYSHPSPLESSVILCPLLRIRRTHMITNQYAISSSSTSLTCAPLVPSSSSSSRRRRLPMAAEISMTSHVARAERLWQQFFSDPSQWWDRRFDKKNSRFPNFKHKAAKKAPRIDNRFYPPRAHAKLASMVKCQEQGQSCFVKPQISVRKEQLWQEFFSDPSQWWDNRLTKRSPKHPDFKHKRTHEGLWIEGWPNPPWVRAKMATMALGQLQSDAGTRSRVSDSCCNDDHVSKLCQAGRLKDALHMVELMVQQNSQASFQAYVALLKGCARMRALAEGKRVHALIVQSGLNSDIFLGNILVDMYAKCGNVLDARKVFNKMPEHNVFSWTAIISAYADHGQGQEAIHLFQQMQETGISPDKVAFVVVLKACTRIAALEQGKQLHLKINKSGFQSDVIIMNTLIDMYAKCGCIEDARQVFNKMSERDVVSWSAMMAGYAQNGFCKEALALYEQMKQEGVQPNTVTYVILIKASASSTALEQGKQLHSDIIRSGFESDVIVGNALVDMYAKCDCIERAHAVFNKMSERDVVSWNSMIAGYVKCGCIEDARGLFNSMNERDVVSWCAMIAGYAQNGLGKDALALYELMKLEGMQPDNATYSILLKACGSIAALEQGKQIHSDIIRSGCEPDVILWNTLVDMYARCGCVEHARQVFNSMRERNVVSWNTMIAGYAQQGLGKEAVTLLEQMQREGTKPDEVTYVSVLSACSHSGLVDAGCRVFDSMYKIHGVTPTVDHYACMVDLLCRAGCLADAEVFINKMPIQPDAVIWRTLLGAARNHGHVEIGRRAFDRVVKLEPENAAAYVLLSNIYGAAGRMRYQRQERK
ncbi:hypothetical protein O6H91_16G069400 [Diphasiastrum complanatum]|uniref:Uncharacterized protein n=1 Tax=Diphasiastrum complanatum TaxID=34168 RepID=A0ACC2BD82_DIPCM|nr:hypothetical protein O6H91_16G069400 [Diphasiastrum complanatum]